MLFLQKISVWLLLLLTCVCQAQVEAGTASQDFEVLNRFSHDNRAFTQGLLFHDGFLYESTGLHGRSTLRKVEPETGMVVATHTLERRFFGEGLALANGQLIQLTWRERVAHVYSWIIAARAGAWSAMVTTLFAVTVRRPCIFTIQEPSPRSNPLMSMSRASRSPVSTNWK